MADTVAPISSEVIIRISAHCNGIVQGVGFRPFVYRVATQHGLSGWVRNSSQGVFLEAEGDRRAVESFLNDLRREAPPLARIDHCEHRRVVPTGELGFRVVESDDTGARNTVILPDMAVCKDCLTEMRCADDRRFRYPFTNCTNCGPRFSIITALPYDRASTTMQRFELCADCQAEYDDPGNRRFHAEPIACPACGPQLTLVDGRGTVLHGDSALHGAVWALEKGAIVGLKGLGGFQLLVDATDERLVTTLRERKHREAKPFAVMVPGISEVEALCHLDLVGRRLLESPESPIVLLRRRTAGAMPIAASVAPGNPLLGVMVPYTPLHHLLMAEFGRPVVATSGNLTDEPIAIDNEEAMQRLGTIADVFLLHDRPVARPFDDSVVRVVDGQPLVLRRARGFAPLSLPIDVTSTTLAVGGQQKNTVALGFDGQAVISQHLGDLDAPAAVANFHATIDGMLRLFERQPERLVADLHPDYACSRAVERSSIPAVKVQHHVAHAMACLADNNVEPPALAITWDGTGPRLGRHDLGRGVPRRPCRLFGGAACALGMLPVAWWRPRGAATLAHRHRTVVERVRSAGVRVQRPAAISTCLR